MRSQDRRRDLETLEHGRTGRSRGRGRAQSLGNGGWLYTEVFPGGQTGSMIAMDYSIRHPRDCLRNTI
jgi:hypothetical protein